MSAPDTTADDAPAEDPGQPRILTPRLVLRAFEDPDAVGLLALYGEPRVCRYYDLEPFVELAQAQEQLERFRARWGDGVGARWAVTDRVSGRFLGDCGIQDLSPVDRRAELGYALRADVWGQGLATEAVGAVVDHVFEHWPGLELHRLVATVDPRNEASRRVLGKLGFQCEGLLRLNTWEKGTFVDEEVHGLLRSEWVERAR